MKYALAFLVIFCFAVTASAQVAADTVHRVKPDTIVLRQYDKQGNLQQTTTWIGTDFHLEEDEAFYEEFPATYWDTLNAFDLDSGTVYTRRYKDGKLSEETRQVNGEDVSVRAYYYADSVFGYDEYDPRVEGIVIYKYHTYEFYLDSTPRIIGQGSFMKREGSYQTFYPNGNLQCDCFYKDGERDSLQSMYHENGQLWTKMLYRDGKMWEVFINLDEKGNELEKGTLKDGNGTRLVYDKQGKLLYTEYYKEGKVKKTVYVE